MQMKQRKWITFLAGGICLAMVLWGCMGAAGQEKSMQQQSVSQTDRTTEDQTASQTEAAADTQESIQQVNTPVRIWGPVLQVGQDRISIDNRAETSSRGEIVITFDQTTTPILDAETGEPENLTELERDEAVFVYIEPAMALSLPPVVNARLILCDIPDDLRIPDYVTVSAKEETADGSFLLTAENGMQFSVNQNCDLMPYRTRNRVLIEDIQSGSSCLIWSDEKGDAAKIVLFA